MTQRFAAMRWSVLRVYDPSNQDVIDDDNSKSTSNCNVESATASSSHVVSSHIEALTASTGRLCFWVVKHKLAGQLRVNPVHGGADDVEERLGIDVDSDTVLLH